MTNDKTRFDNALTAKPAYGNLSKLRSAFVPA